MEDATEYFERDGKVLKTFLKRILSFLKRPETDCHLILVTLSFDPGGEISINTMFWQTKVPNK